MLCQGGIHRRIETRPGKGAVGHDDGDGRRRPPPPAQPARQPAQDQATGDDEDTQAEDIDPFQAEKQGWGESLAVQLKPGEHGCQRALDRRKREPGCRDEANQAGPTHRHQPADPLQARAGRRPEQAVQPGPGQKRQGHRQREDPAKRRVELIDSGQSVIQQRVERRAENEPHA